MEWLSLLNASKAQKMSGLITLIFIFVTMINVNVSHNLFLVLLFFSFLFWFLVSPAVVLDKYRASKGMGVIFAFALHGQDLGFMAMLGTVGLSGVVVNDSLVLVDKVNKLKDEFPEKSILIKANP